MILIAVALTLAVTVGYWMGGLSRQYITFKDIEMSTHALVEMTSSVLISMSKPPDVYAMSMAVVMDSGLIVWKKRNFISTHVITPLRNLASGS